MTLHLFDSLQYSVDLASFNFGIFPRLKTKSSNFRYRTTSGKVVGGEKKYSGKAALEDFLKNINAVKKCGWLLKKNLENLEIKLNFYLLLQFAPRHTVRIASGASRWQLVSI